MKISSIRKIVVNEQNKIKGRVSIVASIISIAAGSFSGAFATDALNAYKINKKTADSINILLKSGAKPEYINELQEEAARFYTKSLTKKDSFSEKAVKGCVAWQRAIDDKAAVLREQKAYQKGMEDFARILKSLRDLLNNATDDSRVDVKL